MNKIKIGKKIIGDTQPLYFIADIGANHNGDLEKAFRLIGFERPIQLMSFLKDC